jgi:retron-type reverse transcriptase
MVIQYILQTRFFNWLHDTFFRDFFRRLTNRHAFSSKILDDTNPFVSKEKLDDFFENRNHIWGRNATDEDIDLICTVFKERLVSRKMNYL